MAQRDMWVHTKTGKEYVIRDFGIMEGDCIPCVIYSEKDNPDSIWVRPCYEFFDGRFRMATYSVKSRNPIGVNPPRGGTVSVDVPAMGAEGPEAVVPQVARRDSVAVMPKQLAPEQGDDG